MLRRASASAEDHEALFILIFLGNADNDLKEAFRLSEHLEVDMAL